MIAPEPAITQISQELTSTGQQIYSPFSAAIFHIHGSFNLSQQFGE